MLVDAVPVQTADVVGPNGVRLTDAAIVRAIVAVVVEERPETSAVQEEIRSSIDVREPSHSTLCVAAVAVGKVGVVVWRACE